MPSSNPERSGREPLSMLASAFVLDPSLLMTEVYSYPFPEVRALLGGLRVDERFMLNTLHVDEAAAMLVPFAFDPPLTLPSHADKSIDLDEIHVPVQDRIVSRLQKRLIGIAAFACRYPIPGSSQSIFNLLAEWHAIGRITTLVVCEGEYEGYRALASSLRIPVRIASSIDDARPVDGEVWFVSNPSARDGNWISQERWHAFVATGCSIVLDAAYVGLTPDNVAIDVSAPNIIAVLTSPSKIFGVFRHRYTGTTFTREPVSSLYGNKWFKNIGSLLDTLRLYESFGDNELPKQYREVQALLCRSVSECVEATVSPSDTLLLGHTTAPLRPEFDAFRRAQGHRFGLTKCFEAFERG